MILSWIFWAEWDEVDRADALILVEYYSKICVLLEVNSNIIKHLFVLCVSFEDTFKLFYDVLEFLISTL